MGNLNWKRQYRLAAGPAGSTAFEVGETSPACPEALNIEFSLQKADLQTQNTGKISIWNLSEKHLAVLNEDNCIVSLKAGYGKTLPLIFTGTISFVSTFMDGADRKTDIEVVDNLIQLRNTYVMLSYKGKVNWRRIMNDVASQMGVTIQYSYNASFVDVSNGFSFVGLAKDVLSKGCKCCGLTWSVQNGVLQVKRPNDVMAKNVYVLSSETGLLGIPAKIKVADRDDSSISHTGWDVEYFLNGAINVDDYVRLESKIARGYFRVYSTEISGSYTGDWTAKARLLEL